MTTSAETSDYIADILEQPARLRALLAAGSWGAAGSLAAAAERCDRVVLTGMGASLFALTPAWLTMVAAGRAAWLVETAELLHSTPGLMTGRTLILAASQSGRSAELVSLTERATQSTTLIAFTNDPSSPLADGAAAVVPIESGEDERAVSTKSYVNTLVAAWLAADALTGQRPREDAFADAADAAEAYLADWRPRVDGLTRDAGLPQRLFLLGRGESLAAASCGALIIKEGSKHQAEAMSSGQFRHGPLELADAGTTAVVLAGESAADRQRNFRLAFDIARYGGRAIIADTKGDAAPPEVLELPRLSLAQVAGAGRAVAEIVALQLLSISLAEQIGIEPGTFRHLEKVTTVE
jgi:glucosamine--fructose-6-phosphate aminotransferase (isomerizing)